MFGGTCILKFEPSDIKVERIEPKDLIFTQQKNDPTALLLNARGFPISASLSSHYSSSLAFNSAKSEKSEVYLFRVTTGVINFSASSMTLSEEMITHIAQLPPLPDELARTSEANQAMEQYYDFFESHGTHVVLQVSLGGLLRVVRQEINIDGRSSKKKYQVAIFRDGGGAVASQLTLALENYSRNHSLCSDSNWTDICMPWVKEVQNDPVFCPDDESTKYCWLYELDGLNKNQKADLKWASESYLTRRRMSDHATNNSTSGVPGELKNIDRQGNSFRGQNLAIQERQVDICVPYLYVPFLTYNIPFHCAAGR